MPEKRKIVQYRERLEKTLASPDLTNNEMLKTLVKSQLLRSSNQEIEGYKEKLVETKAAEVSNILDMLRSASVDGSGGSSTPHNDWKLKQDNEEFRVMYRKGPEGTPFHTLLAEGYVDGPADVCLCLSWEASLYKKWFPQVTVPTFKVIASDCLQKVQIGEQISLVRFVLPTSAVFFFLLNFLKSLTMLNASPFNAYIALNFGERMKLPWPLSMREAIVHYYLFEYLQDDLIVVIWNSVPESKSINGTVNSYNIDAIPEAKDVVRIDLVGGFALQKVTSDRSYIRATANLDIKLDFVPSSLINFISRQLIGGGFRLYQKAAASMMNQDKEFSKALGDSLYVRIREGLHRISQSKAKDGKELKQIASVLSAEEGEDLNQNKQDGAKDISREDRSNQYANNFNGEIVEADCEEIQFEKDDKNVHDIQIKEVDTRSVMKGKMNSHISSEVKQALETLDSAISTVRESGFHILEETPQEEPGTTHIQNFSFKEVNYKKLLPASPGQNHSRPIEAGQIACHSSKRIQHLTKQEGITSN